MSWIDRLNVAIDKCVDQAVLRERERLARLAEQWADAREPERGGIALRNFAEAVRNCAQPTPSGVNPVVAPSHWSHLCGPEGKAAPDLRTDERCPECGESWGGIAGVPGNHGGQKG